MVSAPDFQLYELKGENTPPVYVSPVQYTVVEAKLPPHLPLVTTLAKVASSVMLVESQAAPEAGGARAEQVLMAVSLS